MESIAEIKPFEKRLMMGNQAFARGIIESGASFASGYPGTPSSEIIETLALNSSTTGIYVEWSVNEKTALEAAAAASFANQRAVCVMKQNGVNVASDFLLHLSYSGTRGGLVLIVCDDPGALSSVNEGESRHFAKMLELPLLEPGDFQEAKDIVKTAFELSEKLKTIVIIRSLTRLSHASGIVEAGTISKKNISPYFHHSGFILDPEKGPIMSTPVTYRHELMQNRLENCEAFFKEKNLNTYIGPKNPELIIITSSVDFLYSMEALEELNLHQKVGVLKLVSTNPLPENLLNEIFLKTKSIMFAEQVLPFIEEGVKTIYADNLSLDKKIKFYGKKSGHIPSVGETDTNIIIEALTKIFDINYSNSDEEYDKKVIETAFLNLTPGREMTFCPGCPHRASFFHLNNALKLDDKDGFICGDIGCYTLGMLPSGYSTLKTIHSMGSGTGIASGFGVLKKQGFAQTVLSVCGDSTFFHSGIPPLINAVHNNSEMTMVVLDNSGTAMTGFQPHPGEKGTAIDFSGIPLKIEEISKACGADTYLLDPFDFIQCQEKIPEIISKQGVKLIILRHPCALSPQRKNKKKFKIKIDYEKCVGDNCGCFNFCTKVFKCPALFLNMESKKPEIDPTLCVGCGFCADICFHNSIIKTEAGNEL
ncbi:MAG: indolepyruvate ferredoxin oxidoreductase subunit alpha [Desulforegulaceae bacterium]|nr:indolepyruvate ferredoxin oxidoreductase subunit alpha [Desulforegulaceae bacterium]